MGGRGRGFAGAGEGEKIGAPTGVILKIPCRGILKIPCRSVARPAGLKGASSTSVWPPSPEMRLGSLAFSTFPVTEFSKFPVAAFSKFPVAAFSKFPVAALPCPPNSKVLVDGGFRPRFY